MPMTRRMKKATVEAPEQQPEKPKTELELAREKVLADLKEKQARETAAKEEYDAFMATFETKHNVRAVILSELQRNPQTGDYRVVSAVSMRASD